MTAAFGDRFAYDIDGTTAVLGTTALSTADLVTLNNESEDGLAYASGDLITFLFPQPRRIGGAYGAADSDQSVVLEVSYDTTNGTDGTWSQPQDASFVNMPLFIDGGPVRPGFRQNTSALVSSWYSGSGTGAKGVRVHLPGAGTLRALHLYGSYWGFANSLSLHSLGFEDQSSNGVDNAVIRGDNLQNSGMQTIVIPSAPPAENGTTIDVTYSVECLTDSTVRSWAGQTLLGDVYSQWAATKTKTQPVNSGGSSYAFPMVAVAPDAEDGVWAIRIRADAPGYLPAARYFYISSVSDGAPLTPYGFSAQPNINVIASSTVVALVARGVGATQATYDSHLMLDAYDGVQVEVAPIAWTPVAPSADAYNSSRAINTDTGHADPDHVLITFVVPDDFVGDQVRVTLTNNVTSEWYLWTDRYPDIQMSAIRLMAGAGGETETTNRGVLMHRPLTTAESFGIERKGRLGLDPSTSIPQQALVLQSAPYVVVDGLAMDRPLTGAMSRSVAKARSWAYATDLGAELALGLMGAAARWLPFAGDYSTDTVDTSKIRWNPHFGSTAMLGGKTWYKRGGYPYIDTSYDYYASYERKKVTQAMVHDGNGWFLLDDGTVPAFTWVMVAVLHHPEFRHDYDILSTFQPWHDPPHARDCNLRYESGYVRAYDGARLSSAQLNAPTYKGRIRPTILVWGEEDRHGILGVTDALGRHWHEYTHGAKSPFDLTNFKMGMNGAIGATAYAAIMDVLDLMIFPTRLSVSQAKPIVTKLDHVYGVTGR